MADLKFHCPECDQRLAVDESAAGATIDCPNCSTTFIIPTIMGERAKVVARTKQPALAGRSDSAYEELERKQNELSVALEEAARLRGESERSNSELAKLRGELVAAVADRTIAPVVPARPPVDERVLGENEQLRAKLAAAEAARELLGARLAALQSAPPPGEPAVPSAEELGWKQQLEDLRREFAEVQTGLAAANVARDHLKVEAEQTVAALRDFEGVKAQLSETQARLAQLTTVAEDRQRELNQTREQLGQLQMADEEAAGNAARNQAEAAQQADDFRRQIAAANEALQARAAELDQANRALHDRDDSLRTASQTMEAAKNELDRLKHAADAATHEHTQLRSQFEETTEETKELQHRVDSLLDDLHARERELADARELIMRTTAERDSAQQKLTEKEEELREFSARLEATHRYAESKLLETQQDAEAKVDAAQRDADNRTANAQRSVEELLAAKQEIESRLSAAEVLVADGTARFEALRQSSDSERAAAARETSVFRDRVEQLIQDLGTRETELAEARRKLEGNAVAQEALERQLVVKGEEMTRLNADLETARRELATHLATAQEQAAAVQQEAAAKLENLARVYDAKSAAQREEAAQAARALSEEIEQVKRELSESNKHADSAESRVAALQVDQQRSLRSIEEMRVEMEGARQTQKKAADETVAKEKQIAELLVQLAAAGESEKGVRARAADAEREARARLEAAEQSVEQARRAAADRDRLAEELARAKSDLTISQESFRQARQERDAVRLSVDSLELQIEENLDLFHAAEAERDALKAELEAVRAGLERAKQHVNVLQSRRDQMREEIARLKLQLGQSPDSAS